MPRELSGSGEEQLRTAAKARKLAEIKKDSIMLHDMGIATKIIRHLLKTAGIYDAPLNIDSVHFHIEHVLADPSDYTTPTTVLSVYSFDNAQRSYVVERISPYSLVHELHVSPSHLEKIKKIADCRPAQMGSDLELEALNESMPKGL